MVHSLSATGSDKAVAPKDSRTFRGAGSAKAPTVAVPVRTNEGLVHDADGNTGSPPQGASKPSAVHDAHGNTGSPPQGASKPSAVPLSYDDFTSQAAEGDD